MAKNGGSALLTITLIIGFIFLSTTLFAQENNSLVDMRGTYGASAGFTSNEFLWKDANADYQEKNFRYINAEYGPNTYDKMIYDRYQVEIETNTGTPWNAYAELKIDPWSFVGQGNETVTFANGDKAQIKYDYWENTGRTVNKTYTTQNGNFVNTSELKVNSGRVTQTPISTGFDWNRLNGMLSQDNNVKIDYIFRGVRKLWVEYKTEEVYFKFFPMADQAEALTSDDPLRLSNNHVYYAPSPWLFKFDPGMTVTPDGTAVVMAAKWNWDDAWYYEDSNRNYLTFLRGGTFQFKSGDLATLNITAASPLGLCDTYETFTSLPIAARFKFTPSDKLTLGSTYTSKYGIAKQEIRGSNQVLGFDATYNICKDTDVYGQVAASSMYLKHANEEHQYNTGGTFKAGINQMISTDKENTFKWNLDFTSMTSEFSPGLADYRDTRVDRDWGQHIWFEPLSADDQAARIGNSIDVNRTVLGFTADANVLNNMFNFYFNMRNAHSSYDGKFIENITRFEATYNATKDLQFKGLALQRHYPKTVGGYDPFLKCFDSRYTDQPMVNTSIADGMDADLATLAAGGKMDFFDKKLTIYGIYEATNDPQDFARRELYNRASETVTIDNIRMYRFYDYLYCQDLFDLAPYDYYNIIKGCITVTPVDQVTFKYTHVTNTNRNYAALFDQNNTHDGIEMIYRLMKNMTITSGYVVSRVIDLRRAINTSGSDRKFKAHTNIYSKLDWDFKKDQNLTLEFGEAYVYEDQPGVFGTKWASTQTSVLDTEAIFRIYYQGRF